MRIRKYISLGSSMLPTWLQLLHSRNESFYFLYIYDIKKKKKSSHLMCENIYFLTKFFFFQRCFKQVKTAASRIANYVCLRAAPRSLTSQSARERQNGRKSIHAGGNGDGGWRGRHCLRDAKHRKGGGHTETFGDPG